jgi:hypothetical protein
VSTASTRLFDRVVPFPDLEDAEYVYVETVRELLPRGADDFAATEALGASLMAANGGYGFGGVMRDSLGRRLSPRLWLNASCDAELLKLRTTRASWWSAAAALAFVPSVALAVSGTGSGAGVSLDGTTGLRNVIAAAWSASASARSRPTKPSPSPRRSSGRLSWKRWSWVLRRTSAACFPAEQPGQ